MRRQGEKEEEREAEEEEEEEDKVVGAADAGCSGRL